MPRRGTEGFDNSPGIYAAGRGRLNCLRILPEFLIETGRDPTRAAG